MLSNTKAAINRANLINVISNLRVLVVELQLTFLAELSDDQPFLAKSGCKNDLRSSASDFVADTVHIRTWSSEVIIRDARSFWRVRRRETSPSLD